MAEPMIIVTIPLDDRAEVTVKTTGFAGPACKAATKGLEGLLTVTADVPTAEMRATPTIVSTAPKVGAR